MGIMKYIRETFQKEYKERNEIYRQRISDWKDGPTVARVDKPINIPRARSLGYKAKQGCIVARVRVRKGRRKRQAPGGGRKPGTNFRFISPDKSHQHMAEEKAGRRFKNCEVVNSYWVGEDGQRKYFEVILFDTSHGNFKKSGLGKGRVFRGLTSAAKKHRKHRAR